MTLQQAFPPDRRVRHAGIGALGRAQLVQRYVEALGDLRQLPLHERLQALRLLRAARFDRGAERAQRLQKVLDVVRQPGAGLIDCLRVCALPLDLLAPFGIVEVPHHLREQLEMQQHRR